MAAVKSLVAFMGILILIGLGLLGYGMMRTSDTMSAGRVHEGEARQFGAVFLDQPSESRLREVIPDGAGRVLITVTGGDRPDRVLVVDIDSGRLLGSVHLVGEDGS